MNTTDTRASVAPTHPARSTEGYISSFGEWLEEWDKNRKLELRLGLLHALTLHCECWKFPETQIFLLETADGHLSPYDFGHEHERSATWYQPKGKLNKMSASEGRHTIANKAFDILCNNVFKQSDHGEAPKWFGYIDDARFFDKVLWYLRPDDHVLSQPYNMPNDFLSHTEENFREFLSGLAKAIWDPRWRYHVEHRDWTDDTLQRFNETKFKSVVWLSHLGRLTRLDEYILSDTLLNELENALLALKYSLPRLDKMGWDPIAHRCPRSLDEIIHLPLAQFVVTRRIQNRNERQNESARQRMRAERKKKEDAERREKIEEKMKQLKEEKRALEKA